MSLGKIIEYIDKGKFVCSLCLQDRGTKLHLLTTLNREVNLSPKRAILISEPTLDPLNPREELLEQLKKTEQTRETLKTRINVKELWELVCDENEHYGHPYLAQLVFGEDISGEHLSALIRALFEDRLYFKMKDGHFLANSEEKVDLILKQREEEKQKKERLEQGGAWLKAVRQGMSCSPPPFEKEIIDLLTDLALYGGESPQYKFAKDLLARAGIADMGEARKLLILLGVWEEDENLALHRLHIPAAFTAEQEQEAERLSLIRPQPGGRKDLRDLQVMTIDGPLTQDFDDALSLEREGDILRLGIHIADVDEVIKAESALDLEAMERASSLYLPRRQIPMFPVSLSQDVLSLRQGCERPAISLLVTLKETGDILDYGFIPSIIRVQRQLTYDTVDEDIAHDEQLALMHKLSGRLQAKRLDQGALNLSLPEVQVRLGEKGDLTLQRFTQDTPSRNIVSEFMILYNWLAAEYCRGKKIPVLFRRQSEPKERLSRGELNELYYVFKQRRNLSPLQIDTQPRPHSGLGLDVYIHATSPIRRYFDLMAQRQIKGCLMGGRAFYDEAQLEEIRMSVEPVLKGLQMVKRDRLRYWVLKYLNAHRDKKFKAVVLDEMRNKFRIILADFFMAVEMKRQEGYLLGPGQEIWVDVKKADPIENVLELSLTG